MSKQDIRKPHLKEFYRDQQGKDYITYPGLLAEFHLQNDTWMKAHPEAEDRRSIKATLVQVPNDGNSNVAICTSLVVMSSGAEYAEIADAAPNNVGPLLKNALPRMAATRCKGRALRDATNIGTTMYEELPDADVSEQDEGEPAQPTRGPNVREFNDVREQPTGRNSNYTPIHETRPTETRDGAATANQLATIAKLSRLLGQDAPSSPGEVMSYAEASEHITALSHAYNEQKGAPVPSQRGAQAQERATGGGASEAQLKAIYAMSRRAGTPENPKASDYTKSLASARIEELQSILDSGGQQ